MKPPIFIIGNPRSGTTLLRLMLTCHPAIVIPPECGFAVWLYDAYKSWDRDRDPDLLNRWIADLAGCRKIETWNLHIQGLSVFLESRPPSSYSEAVSAVYEWYAREQGRPSTRWGDKNNFHVNHVGTIRTLFPEAFFVHLVRDGRDVACSYRELNRRTMDSRYAPNLPNEIADIAREWTANVENVNRAFSAFDRERVTEIRYETLTSEPEVTLKALCDFLEEEYDERMLTYPEVNRARQLEPAEFLQWKEKTLRPPTPRDQAPHLTQLTPEEIRTFEEIGGGVLRKYGYAT